VDLWPGSGITLSLAALVGMAAMFAGASRALLTSIIFAIETTGQSNALLPLLAACTASYWVSFLLMENTIMTEKIARRGVKTPHSYEPDVLEKVKVEQVIKENGLVLSEDNNIGEVREWLEKEKDFSSNFFIIVSNDNSFRGIISSSNLFSNHHAPATLIGTLIKRKNISIAQQQTLRTAVEIMARENLDVLPVVSKDNNIVGVLSYRDIIAAYSQNMEESSKTRAHISLKRHGLKMLLHGQKLITIGRKTGN
jgi:chloride channel protein, CIC family